MKDGRKEGKYNRVKKTTTATKKKKLNGDKRVKLGHEDKTKMKKRKRG